MRKLALVTGASSGIGAATAEILAENKYDLFVSGRRSDRLDALKQRLEATYGANVTPLVFDVRDREACGKIIEKHEARLRDIDVLVNNAGLARGVESFQESDMGLIDEMVQTNLSGLLYMTRLILPFMLKRNSGHIVNIGSVSGRWTSQRNVVYNATKHAVLAVTESLRLDLMGTKIRVTNVEPGLVASEFGAIRFGSEERSDRMLHGIQKLQPRDVAETVFWCLNRPIHVNIQEVVIFPVDQAGVGYVTRSQNR